MSRAERAEPTPAEVERVVGQALRVRKRVKESSGPHAVADCPWCSGNSHLYVNLESGLWDCKVAKCGESGNLWKLADRLGIRVREEPMIVRHMSQAIMATARARKSEPRAVENVKGIDLAKVQAGCDRLFNPEDKAGAAVRAYLTNVRGLADETIRRFKLGVAVLRDKDCPVEVAVGIPYIEDNKVPLVKMRNLATDKDARKFRRTPGGYSGLYNQEGIKGCRQVVLVEGELDVHSLWQLGIHNVASTSLGAKKTIPDEWMDALSDVEDIVLWYDEDDSGQAAATALVEQLGSYRCRHARMPEGSVAKDANHLLTLLGQEQAAAVAKAVVADAKGLMRSDVVTPGKYADVLTSEIMGGEKTLGISTGWPCLDRLMRGVRPGELTLVTGHTNHGKTTFVLNLLRNLSRAGHPAMASAMENGPIAIARKIFQQEHGLPISAIKTEKERTAAFETIRQLDRDPFYVLDLYGRHPVSRIVDAFRYARHRLGVRYFALDHLHFLAKSDARKDRLDHLDDVIAEVQEATRVLGIHIFLIAHPNGRITPDTIPDGDTIKGCSSAKQEADNGLTVFRAVDAVGTAAKKKMKIKDAMGRRLEIELGETDVLVQCWKTRHDEASEGTSILGFQRKDLRYLSKDPAAGAAEEQPNDAVNVGEINHSATPPTQTDWASSDDPFGWGGQN